MKNNNSINNDLPLISIVMVSYNQENMIEQSILSVLNQNYLNLEFIVIDGKSTDHSLDIINKYSNKIKIIISEPDKGMYYARNKGISLCSGDYIGFINTDDLLYPGALNDIALFIIKENYPDMVYGYTIGLDKNGDVIDKITFGAQLDLSKKEYFKKMKTIPDQSTFYKRDTLRNIGQYDTSLRFGADTDLKCRFILNETKICVLPKIIAGWRIYEDSLTYRKDLRKARIKEAILVNHRYSGKYINYYTIRLLIYNYIVPNIKQFIKYINNFFIHE